MVRKEVVIWVCALLLLLVPSLPGRAEAALYRVKTERVNIRVGPGTSYTVLAQRNRGDIVTVIAMYNKDWAKIRYGADSFAYISRHYIEYQGPVPEQVTEPQPQPARSQASVSRHTTTMDAIFKIARILAIAFLVLAILCAYADADAAVMLTIPFSLYLIGYIIGFLLSNAHLGAVIGEGTGLVILLIHYAGEGIYIDIDLSNLVFKAWLVASWPFWTLDRLQLFLSKPWRGKMKTHWAPEWKKASLRKRYSLLKIPFYILLFPLRLLNAVYYNMIIHPIYELSNYILEVLAPSDTNLGADSALLWIVCFPVRVVYYLGYHFTLTIVESVIWTIIDTFIPAVTLFHGTADRYAAEMVSEPLRTRESKKRRFWTTGTWNVGLGNYAGDGIYFGISRRTLRNYQRGSCIVTRVSMGKVVDITLMPASVYSTAGNPNAHDVSKWGLTHGYTTGEWWRAGANWWEFCLFDRQNRYNDSWRIRPVYVLNYSKGIMQRIPRGSAHWLFRRMVIKDIVHSLEDL